MSLQEYRDKLALEAFFQDGKLKTLDDLIREKAQTCGQAIRFEVNDSDITLFPGGAPYTYPASQMSFYTHELMSKYADIFGQDWA